MIVGLTGGIGSGKSEVAKMLESRGAFVIDTDALARDVVEPPSPVLDSIREAFGDGVIGEDGRLDRTALAAVVFADETKRRRLNDLTHPEILKRVLAIIGGYPPSAIVVVVVPLLFESGFERNCDVVAAVVAPAGVRVLRVVARDGRTAEEVRARMDAQLPEDEYSKRAGIVIRNDGDRASLEREVDRAWQAILARRA